MVEIAPIKNWKKLSKGEIVTGVNYFLKGINYAHKDELLTRRDIRYYNTITRSSIRISSRTKFRHKFIWRVDGATTEGEMFLYMNLIESKKEALDLVREFMKNNPVI